MRRIDLYIDDISELRAKYNDNALSRDVSDYILGECLTSTRKDKIVINVITDKNLNHDDMDEVERLIRNNYRELLLEKNMIRNYQVLQSFFLSLFGILFIVISNVLKEQILSELFLIVGWVAFGEVIYKILFDNVNDKIKKERYKRLSHCQIEFITKKKP